MNTKKWTEIIFENLGPKIVCLGLAIFLYIFNRTFSLERKTITVPLRVEANGLMMPYSDVPKFVKIHVRSSAEHISAINGSSFNASLNLDNFTEAGNYTVPVTITTNQNLMLLETLEYTVHPEFINVDLDEKILRYVPVQPVYSGEVEHGYQISNVDINPSTVKVAGPSKILNKVKHIYTRKVNINGASLSLSQEVKIDNINPKLEVITESDFKVTVTITPAPGERVFESVKVFCYGLSDEFEISGEIPALNIRLSGTVPVLESFEPQENFVTADMSSITEPGTFEIPVVFNLPDNIVMSEKQKDTVTVTVIPKVSEAEPLKTEEETAPSEAGKE